MDLITFSGDSPKLSDPSMLGQTHYVRRPADHYPTPAWVTEALVPHLLRYVPFDMRVWECACGTGAMANVLTQHFHDVVATDLEDYGYPLGACGIDFLSSEQREWRGAIVTNPPYGDIAEQFIRHALLVTKPYGVVAMLLRHEYDTAKGRVDLFNQPPFALRLNLTTRPRWIEGTVGAPRHAFAWFVWSWAWTGNPEVQYHVTKA